jgi:hypothetical protein
MLRSIKMILGMTTMALTLIGCAAVLIGGLLHDNATDNTKRATFTEDFNKQNLERERAGLTPLDWCSEIYKAKKAWAMSEKSCAERVQRHEAGDLSALTL